MEKRSPHCQLSIVKALIQQGKVRTTYTALTGASALGLDVAGIVEVVLALTGKDFYKYMTTTLITVSGRMSIAPTQRSAMST
jgi:motility quorum-sensing regulator/GCU-specific mRNA interferase toxin